MPETEILPAGSYTAIVCYTKTVDLKSRSKILILELIITRGPHQGKRCEKKLFFGFDEEQEAKSKFVRMGGVLRSLETTAEDAMELEGSLLSIQVRYDEVGRQKVLICRHLGRGEVKRYL